jgi:DNA-binding NarL/FixJ family response regulator
MSVTLNQADVEQLARLSTILLSPLDAESLDDWRRDAALALGDLVGAENVFFLSSGLPGVDVLWSERLAKPLAQAYRERFRDDEGSRRALRSGIVAYNQELIVAGEWDGYHRDPTVNELFKPHGVDDAVGLIMTEVACGDIIGGKERYQLGAVRTPFGAELFGDKGLAMMRLLKPSFIAGIRIVAETQQWRRSLAESIDMIDVPAWIFTLDASGVEYGNASARALAKEEREAADIEAAAATVARALAASTQRKKSADASNGRVEAVKDFRTGSNSYAICGCHVGPALLTNAAAILVMARRTSPRPLDTVCLRDAYRLTTREIQVAELLREGLGAPDVAGRLGISQHTARRHIERIYQKLDVHSHFEAHRVLHELSRAGAPELVASRDRQSGR